MPSQLAISVSDLHMGRGTRQDDFRGDAKFAQFCADVGVHAASTGQQLTFVLNGDILDLWEIVSDDELQMDGGPAILSGLVYPATSPEERQRAVQRGMWQIDQCLLAHPQFVAGLAALLQTSPTTRIHYLVGNHDHPMVNPALQAHLLTRLSELTALPLDASRIQFGLSLMVPGVRSYFEHGNQFSGNDSGFADVLDPWSEAPGYYFLRFIWNRLQEQYGYSDNLVQVIRLALLVIFNPGAPVAHAALSFLYEYFEAHRRGLVPKLVHGPAKVMLSLYKDWLKDGAPQQLGSSTDAKLKKRVEETKDRPLKMTRQPGTTLLGDAHPGIDPPDLPGHAVHINNDENLRDEYWVGLRERFSKPAPPFPKLNKGIFTVFLGHTHAEKLMVLRNPIGGPTCRYVNTGSWTHASRLVYGWANDDADVFHSRGAKTLD